jgi:hypothetical protein
MDFFIYLRDFLSLRALSFYGLQNTRIVGELL